MTPYEHYQEAERYLVLTQNVLGSSLADAYLAQAQVHATLALCGDLSGAWEK